MQIRIGSVGSALVIGGVVGFLIATDRGPLHAGASDRVEGSVLASARIALQQNPTNRNTAPQDAIYYLDYKGGRLLAAIPSFRQVGTRIGILGEFASRDLVADFRLEPGLTPHFAIVSADMGVSHAGSALFVVETTTGRIATYLAELQGAGPKGELPPKLELVEIRNLP